jgi:hypothetical protein
VITGLLSGGIGNQLSQVASALSVAWDRGDECIFDRRNYRRLTQGNLTDEAIETIFGRLRWADLNLNEFTEYGSDLYDGCELPASQNICLTHHFSFSKYFYRYRDRLVDLFKPSDKIKQQLVDRYNPTECCSIHVRRGDFLRFPRFHSILPIKYYAKAIERFPPDTRFIIFSDDIPWCRQRFSGNVTFSEGNSDVIDLYLMSLCRSNIIANSTFSLWAATLNQNPDKRIIKFQQYR